MGRASVAAHDTRAGKGVPGCTFRHPGRGLGMRRNPIHWPSISGSRVLSRLLGRGPGRGSAPTGGHGSLPKLQTSSHRIPTCAIPHNSRTSPPIHWQEFFWGGWRVWVPPSRAGDSHLVSRGARTPRMPAPTFQKPSASSGHQATPTETFRSEPMATCGPVAGGSLPLKTKVSVQCPGSSSGPGVKQVVRGRTRGMRVWGATSEPYDFWHYPFQNTPIVGIQKHCCWHMQR